MNAHEHELAHDDDENQLAGIRCARCDRIAPITAGELRCDGDSSLPIVLPVPPGWTPLAEETGMDGEEHEEQVAAVEFDPDQIVCPECVLPHERDAWLDQLNTADRAAAASGEDEDEDDDGNDNGLYIA